MSSPTNPTRAGSASSGLPELRQDIEKTRGELADTVNALAHKADVKTRAQDKAQELKAQVLERAQELKAQAVEQAPEARAWATAKAQQLTGTVREKVQEKPAAAVGVALAMLGLLILRPRRRRKEPSNLTKLRWDIEALRDQLATTVDALSDNADVRSRALDKTQEFTARAAKKAKKLKAQAM